LACGDWSPRIVRTTHRLRIISFSGLAIIHRRRHLNRRQRRCCHYWRWRSLLNLNNLRLHHHGRRLLLNDDHLGLSNRMRVKMPIVADNPPPTQSSRVTIMDPVAFTPVRLMPSTVITIRAYCRRRHKTHEQNTEQNFFHLGFLAHN